MTDAVLALNAGSSSLKVALFDVAAADALELAFKGQIEGVGAEPHFFARDPDQKVLADERWDKPGATFEELLSGLLEWVERHLGQRQLIGVGHRIVHGGRDFVEPVRLDPDVLARLDELTPLAPLHQPHGLAPVRVIARLRPDLPQIGCFDTAFHHAMPPEATRFALPRRYEDAGVRRYGFHGLSYEYIARMLRRTAPGLAAGRVIVAHLGSGASLCAMRDGRSVDTTMGFSALDGLVMGTRCGALDPGVLLYLLQEEKLAPHEIETLLYKDAGLVGVSGLSGDIRILHQSDDPKAKEAIQLFVYRLVREISGLVGVLGGLDAIVFTAGIGEHDPAIRAAVADRLAWLGLTIDAVANQANALRISGADSRIEVRVIPTDEEAMVAEHTLDLITGN